jgi:hypothetical protein
MTAREPHLFNSLMPILRLHITPWFKINPAFIEGESMSYPDYKPRRTMIMGSNVPLQGEL